MQKNNIINILVESGAISEERASILSSVTTPCSTYGLSGDTGLQHFENPDFLITDDELRALVKIENLLSEEVPETSRDTTLPLLMVILVRLLEYAKDPNEMKKDALDDVIDSYHEIKKEMDTFIYQSLQEQIDMYVARYKLNILKKILKQ